MSRDAPRFARWIALALLLIATAATPAAESGWSFYGADAGGRRYSDAALITPDNVPQLRRQWMYRTGDIAGRPAALMQRVKFETTPILVADKLVLCSSFNEIIALDPASGAQAWRFDPGVATDLRPANRYNCRGVAHWRDPDAPADAPCALRILGATADARVVALDARSGAPCAGFGKNGQVRIETGALLRPGEWQSTSAPVVAGGVVIVGSAIDDNQRAAAPSGRVHAFDLRTGALRWSWDPLLPQDGVVAGAANVWAPMSVDEARGLVFLPTSSPSPDFYGGMRPGANRHADSVVALRAADGSVAWAFQIVKHDVWDYDVAAQPTLATLQIDGKPRDVVVQATKQGLVFVLDRDSGAPVFPVEERAVPQGGAPGEMLSATQTFPADMPALVPSALRADDAFGFTPFDRAACRDRIAALRHEGLYTPPSVQGTLLFPFTGGGVNWGGVAIDPNGIVYANTTRAAHSVRLIPRDQLAATRAANPGKEVSAQAATPFGMIREVVLSPFGAPCNPPPWGTIAALDLRARRILWEVPLGTTESILPLGVALATGMPNAGGPVATAGGLVFIGATMDRYLRAFDARSGAEVWRGGLPASAMATPMTYVWKGRQYVVIAAGGHGEFGVHTGDAIVAFALPAPGEAQRSVWDRHFDQPGVRAWVTLASGGVVLAATAAAALWWRRKRRRRAQAQR
ncbi:MAG: pyrroloquinoline quinone-dependent dehydrogenase [Burkholderiaceae bacterium]